MQKKKAHPGRPSSKNTSPICLSMQGTLSKSLILLNQSITSTEILWVVVMIIAFVYGSKELFEVNEMVHEDLVPNCMRQGIRNQGKLNLADKDVEQIVDCKPKGALVSSRGVGLCS